MSDARSQVPPKFQFYQNKELMAIMRDNILLRITPRLLRFQIDFIEKGSEIETTFNQIKSSAQTTKSLYGVFGYIKLKVNPYLILIEEASIVGQIMKGTVYKVQKLMFIPMTPNGLNYIHQDDKPFIDMINHVQKEKAFYFSYSIDLTKNMQMTLFEVQQGYRAPKKT